MKWREFIEQVEKQGVTDDTEIAYIDVMGDSVDVTIDRNKEAQIT